MVQLSATQLFELIVAGFRYELDLQLLQFQIRGIWPFEPSSQTTAWNLECDELKWI